jgi:hypothetical protein
MKSKELIRKNIQLIIDTIKQVSDLLTPGVAQPLQFIRVIEKFDVIERPQFKGVALRLNVRS